MSDHLGLKCYLTMEIGLGWNNERLHSPGNDEMLSQNDVRRHLLILPYNYVIVSHSQIVLTIKSYLIIEWYLIISDGSIRYLGLVSV